LTTCELCRRQPRGAYGFHLLAFGLGQPIKVRQNPNKLGKVSNVEYPGPTHFKYLVRFLEMAHELKEGRLGPGQAGIHASVDT
jgi:hypothetical protein